MKQMIVVVWLAFGLLAQISAWAGPLITENYLRIGEPETLVAPFISPSTATLGSYSGLVEISVAGSGSSYGSHLNDAFYLYTGEFTGEMFDPAYYQLNVGWAGFELAAFAAEPHNIDNFIVFVEGIGEATSPFTPAYDALAHAYHFVIDVPADAGPLQFGVADGAFSDNTGEFNIEVV